MAHSNAAGIASICRLPEEAQRAAADRQDLALELSSNPHVNMTNEVWLQLYATKPLPPAGRAEALVFRTLDDTQIRHVLKHESRVRPVESMLEVNRLSVEQIEFALSKKKIAATVAKTLASQGILFDVSFDEELRGRISVLAGPDASLAWLDARDAATFEEIAAVLGHETFLHPARVRRDDRPIITRLVEKHPALIELCIREDVSCSLFQIACGSRHLGAAELQAKVLDTASTHADARGVEFALLALVNSPVCRKETVEKVSTASWAGDKARDAASRRLAAFDTKPTVEVPYREVEDQTVLEWLVRRACSFNSRYGDYTPPKPFEVAELCHNPHLSDEHKGRLGPDLYNDFVRSSIGEEAFLAAFTALHDKTFDPLGTEEKSPHLYVVRELNDQRSSWTSHDEEKVEEGGNVVARMVQHTFRMHSHIYVEKLEMNYEQWRLFLELVDVMPDALLSEIAAVAQVS